MTCGTIDGKEIRRTKLNPFIPKTFAAELMSSGKTFKPPIRVKTISQSIVVERMNIAAPSKKLIFKNNIIIKGKKAKTGIDCKISKIGKSIFSAKEFFTTSNARGIATVKAITYETSRRTRVKAMPRKMSSREKFLAEEIGEDRKKDRMAIIKIAINGVTNSEYKCCLGETGWPEYI